MRTSVTEAQAEQRAVIERLRRDARVLATAFALPLQTIDAERANVKRRYGVCYDDGSIRIRLRHVRTRNLLKYSSLVDTLCHELAHLRHFDHSPRFEVLYQRILSYARRRGIYRPTPRGTRGHERDTLIYEGGVALRGSSVLPVRRPEVRRPEKRPEARRRPPREPEAPKGPVQLSLFEH